MSFRTILSTVLIFVLFGISVKNSFTVTKGSGEAIATCISEPSKRSRWRRSFNSLRESRFRYQDEDGNSQEASNWFSIPRPKSGAEMEIPYVKKSPELFYYNSVYQFQVIITEHADIDQSWYQDAVVERWRGGPNWFPRIGLASILLMAKVKVIYDRRNNALDPFAKFQKAFLLNKPVFSLFNLVS